MKYEFHVGDYVENKDGDVGYIEKVCNCSGCEDRGFYEPYIRYGKGDADYITFSEADRIPQNFKRIGRYDFTKKDKIEHLSYDGSPDWDDGILIDKINELVDAVNAMRESAK